MSWRALFMSYLCRARYGAASFIQVMFKFIQAMINSVSFGSPYIDNHLTETRAHTHGHKHTTSTSKIKTQQLKQKLKTYEYKCKQTQR